MGGLGFPEILVILTIALLVFGTNRLPEAGKALGKAIRGFKEAVEGKEAKAAHQQPEARACPGCGQGYEGTPNYCAQCGRSLRAP